MKLLIVKRCDWIDTKTFRTWYGLKGKAEDGKWYYLSEGAKALRYSTAKRRDAKLKEIRQRHQEGG